jgi:hypothetical protein
MKKTFVALSAVILIFGVFQNCGPTAYKDGVESSAAGISLGYPYPSKPAHYVDVQMLVDPSASAQLKQFKLLVNIGEAEVRELILAYKIEVTDASGKVMCPSNTGTLQTDATQIAFDCVSPYVESQLHVKVTVTLDKKSDSYDFIF